MDSCCRLGKELMHKKNVLYESKNYFLVPALGSMGIEGYILLCSKKHYIGMGDIPKKHELELENILRKIKKTFFKVYNSEALIFEHGPKLKCSKGGGCLEHAHLHAIPISENIIKYLEVLFKLNKINNFNKLREIYKEARLSYLFIEQNNKKYIIELDFPVPSQYLRQVLASKLKISEWDWRVYSDYKTFKKTLKKLHNKF